MDIRQVLNLVEAANKDKLVLSPLLYSRDSLAPVMSQATINYHYGKLAKSYVDRYNKGEGDAEFNKAGTFLHNIFFAGLQAPKTGNKPHGTSAALIDRRWTNFDRFKDEFGKAAMSIQGSGWIYMTRGGEIKTIKNHAERKDIALLIDWWEHAWALDYASNKKKYLDNMWRCINWEYVNRRIYGAIK